MPQTTIDRDESVRKLERRFCSEAAAKGHYVAAFCWAMRARDRETAEHYIDKECEKFTDAGFPDAAQQLKKRAMELASSSSEVNWRDVYIVEFEILGKLSETLAAKTGLPNYAPLDMDDFYRFGMWDRVQKIGGSLDALAAQTAFTEGLLARVWDGGAEEASISGYKPTIDRLFTKEPGYEPIYNSIHDTQFDTDYNEGEMHNFALKGYVQLRLVEGSALRCMAVAEGGELARHIAGLGLFGAYAASKQALLARQIGIVAEYAAAADSQVIGKLDPDSGITLSGIGSTHEYKPHMEGLNALKAGYAGIAYTNSTIGAFYDAIRDISRHVGMETARIHARIAMISDFASATRDGNDKLDPEAVRSFVRGFRAVSKTYRPDTIQLALEGRTADSRPIALYDQDSYTKLASTAYVRLATEAIIAMYGWGHGQRFRLPVLLHSSDPELSHRLGHEEHGWNFYVSCGAAGWEMPETIASDTDESIIYLLGVAANTGRAADVASIERLVAYELGRHMLAQQAPRKDWEEFYSHAGEKPAAMLINGLAEILGCYLMQRATHANSRNEAVARAVAGRIEERATAMAERASAALLSDILNAASDPSTPNSEILKASEALVDEAERYTRMHMYSALHLAAGLYIHHTTIIMGFVQESCWRTIWNWKENREIDTYPMLDEFGARLRALDAGVKDEHGGSYLELYMSSYKHEASDIKRLRELRSEMDVDLKGIGSGNAEETRESIKSLERHIRALYATEADRARKLIDWFDRFEKASQEEKWAYIEEMREALGM